MKGTKRLIEVLNRLDSLEEQIEEFYQDVKTSLEGGGKILLFGNGGSAADSQHIAAEFIVRFKDDRKSIPAIALTTDASIITATANDYCYEDIFKRQIEALMTKKDILISISTSGNSKNNISALKYSKKKKFNTLNILGNKGGEAKKYSKNNFIVDSSNPSRIQEVHIIFYQNVCDLVENYYFTKSKN